MVRKSEPTVILRRGSACLSCRRRKLKCNGIRPACDSCTSMNRTSECKYDDSSRKSHTRKLLEHQEALEARLRELESKLRNPRPPTSSSLSIEAPTPTALPQSTAWDIFSSTSLPSMDPPWDIHIRPSSTSSTTLSDRSVSIPLGLAYNANLPADPSMTLTKPSAHDRTPDRVLHDSVTLSIETHNSLIQMFIEHRKQCCFYTNVSRFDRSSSATVFQNSPPSSALMSVIYLLGSFFAGVKNLEMQLLEQTLHDVARTLHNQEQLVDTVQALCLLAEYFYFNNRDIEGSRHLNAAKRLALELGLHQVTHPTFLYDVEVQSDFGLWDSEWREQAAVFWQVVMVDSLWSATNDCSLQGDLESPCPNIITPLPVEDGLDLDLAFGNSTIHSLFEGDNFQGLSLSVTAFKALAAVIFDRSVRLHNSSMLAPRDHSLWAHHHSTELALQRLSALVHPFTWPDSSMTQVPSIDTDLYVVHTLIVASTIHLHLDHVMDLQISWAANRVVELIHNLTVEDFQFLDPVLALCWSAILRVFNQMIKHGENSIKGDAKSERSASYTATSLHPCIAALYSALQNMSVSVPIAEDFLAPLKNNHASLYPLI